MIEKTNSFVLNDEARKGNIGMTRRQVEREIQLMIATIIFLSAGAGSLVFEVILGNMAAALRSLLLAESALLSILIALKEEPLKRNRRLKAWRKLRISNVM